MQVTSPPRPLRAVLALLAAFALGGGATAVVVTAVVVTGSAPAGAATHATATHKKKAEKKNKKKKPRPPKPVTIAPGAVVRYSDVRVSSHRVVRAAVLRFDLRNRHVALGATVPGGAIGAGRQTVATQARLTGAAAGVNADFFDVAESGGTPKGGYIAGGVVFKSPRRDWNANLYVRGGRAAIGPVNMTGLVTRAERPARPPVTPVLVPGAAPTAVPATSRTLSAVNSVKDLAADRIVLVTPLLARPVFGRTCAVAVGTTSAGGTRVVTATYPRATSIRRLTGTQFALVACGTGPRATWLAGQVAAGDTVTVSTTFVGGTPSVLVSGGRVLVRNGRAFDDRDGKTIRGRNPETFGCLSRSGRTVVLGTIDGRHEGSSGMTVPELTRYLLTLKCWSGIVFDGGGSSTLVGRRLGTSSVRVLNRPSDRTGARRVTTGLMLYRR